MVGGLRLCDICDDPASCFCPADDAFLCDDCDKQIHEANFLAKKHNRVSVCHLNTPCSRRLELPNFDPGNSEIGSVLNHGSRITPIAPGDKTDPTQMEVEKERGQPGVSYGENVVGSMGMCVGNAETNKKAGTGVEVGMANQEQLRPPKRRQDDWRTEGWMEEDDLLQEDFKQEQDLRRQLQKDPRYPDGGAKGTKQE
ncbi:hypothetical protein BDA96_10G109600, partial [Sorghum bicolor]